MISANKEPTKSEEQIPECDWFTENFYTRPSKIKFLGKGSFGKVFHVISREDKSHKALKIQIFTSESEYKDSKQEIKLTKKLNHKNIIKIEDYHCEKLANGVYAIYIVLELAQGSLQAEISKGILRDQISYYNSINQLVQAIKYCHEKNIVHFDLKPDNILIFADDLLKVADWGAAKPGLSKGTLTFKDYNLGCTKVFASPELLEIIEQNVENFENLQKNWQKMDVYALGVTLLSFLGLSQQKIVNIKSKHGKKYDDLLEVNLKELITQRNFQQEWIDLFKYMLAYEPQNRFTIDKVAEYLKSMSFINNQMDLVRHLMSTTGTLDLLFVLDTTGTMDYYMEAVLKSLNNILINMKQSTNKRKINIGCLFYKDLKGKPVKLNSDEVIPKELLKEKMKEEEDPRFLTFLKGLEIYNDYINYLQFTPSIEIIEKKLKELKYCCFGGDDYCEDLVEALKASMEMNWTYQSTFRIMVIITDAPPHGKSYYELAYDNYPEKDKQFDNLEETVRRLVKMKIGILIIEIDKRTKRMNEIIEKICKKENGFFQKVVLEEMKDPEYMKQFFETEVINEIDSIFKDQWNIFLEKKIKDNINWEMQIDWEKEFDPESIKEIKFQVYDFELVKDSLDFNNLSLLRMENDRSSKWNASVSKKRVLEGNLRNIHLMLTHKSQSKYVIKLPKDGSYNMIEELMDDWKNYTVSYFVASKFKKELKIKGINLMKNLDFLNLIILESEDPFKGSRFFACEKFLDGIFLKYNSNLGWVLKPKDKIDFDVNDLVQAFSHYSFQMSKGKLVIVDIQGVQNVMTDPAIQSMEQAFGSTDLGRYGIYKFLRGHICTKFCKKLELNDISEEIELVEAQDKKLEEAKFSSKKGKNVGKEEEEKKFSSKAEPIEKKNGKWLKEKNATIKNFSLYKEFKLDSDPCEDRLNSYYDYFEKGKNIGFVDITTTGDMMRVNKNLDLVARLILRNDINFEETNLKLLKEEFWDNLYNVEEKYRRIYNLHKIEY